jgi:acylphosphatase
MVTANVRVEITINGLVQGVGFRYFVLKQAKNLEINGYVKNLYTGEVLTVAEGEKFQLLELIKLIKSGPSHSYVKNCKVEWSDFKNEFKTFEITF